MCVSCKADALAGIVIDGTTRDRIDIAEMDFPVYARGFHPQGPLKQNAGSINITVTCGEVAVDPGDVIAGDDEGVTVVPRERAAGTLEAATEKMTAERSTRERVEAGESLFERKGYDTLCDDVQVVGPEDSV